ncbi:FAD-dependent monooxygenase [Gandjariella thermophila]|uniref:FAD-dependent oxidoreductase n=1 Tax=Gandjariella thermophila TaxID=1931992 RepID=A0A4D4J4R3_9PSEU|nr:FAD-dependent monooxygenase [Gandjariella thermophila]GDY29738.1 FAD-dependent oxidoreductase [Gandjariella thermophila]
MSEETPVLIVGGSMVGLASALFLAHHGIRPLLVERHARLSMHPRSISATPRTMEILRALGLEREVRAAENPNARYGRVVQVESLAGRELGWFDGPFREDDDGVSATGWTLIGQDRLEPILFARAEALGADIRLATEMVDFHADVDGVTAVIRDRASGATRTVRAAYLIAADGNRSGIRATLGIGTHGLGTFSRQLNVLFRADLTEYVAGRRFFLCFVNRPEVHGVLGQLDASPDGRWRFAASVSPGQTHDRYSERRCAELVRTAVGVADLDLTVLDVTSWEIAARVADRFRAGRVLLAGDAAHVMPPTGGFGGNLGVQDAHNLAWKLSLVLRGAAAPGLLDSYDAERRPVAEFTVDQGVLRYRQHSNLDEAEAARFRPPSTVQFGHIYRSPAVLPENPDDGAVVEDPTRPSGRPGTRAPHLWLRHHGRDIGVHDLVRRDFLLLAAARGGAWLAAAERAATDLGIPVDAYQVDSAGLVDVDGAIQNRYGLTDTGAVLIRPDGFIAYRAARLPGDAAAALTGVLGRLLGGRGPVRRQPGADRAGLVADRP